MLQLRLTVTAETMTECEYALTDAARAVRTGEHTASRDGWSYHVHAVDDLGAAATATRTAQEHEATIALRTLAHAVRAAHPTAHTVSLDGSDQGDFAVLVAVHDATGTPLDEPDAVDPKQLMIAEEAAEHVHPDRAYLLTDHLVDGTRLDARQPIRATLRVETLLAL